MFKAPFGNNLEATKPGGLDRRSVHQGGGYNEPDVWPSQHTSNSYHPAIGENRPSAGTQRQAGSTLFDENLFTGFSPAPAAAGRRHLDDSSRDAELLARCLDEAGLAGNLTIAHSMESFRRELAGSPDVILTNFRMPRFGALDVLKIVRNEQPDTPVIIVSGTIGEDAAVDAMRASQDVGRRFPFFSRPK